MRYDGYMSEQKEGNEMSKGQKKTGVPESRERKKKILKVGGLVG